MSLNFKRPPKIQNFDLNRAEGVLREHYHIPEEGQDEQAFKDEELAKDPGLTLAEWALSAPLLILAGAMPESRLQGWSISDKVARWTTELKAAKAADEQTPEPPSSPTPTQEHHSTIAIIRDPVPGDPTPHGGSPSYTIEFPDGRKFPIPVATWESLTQETPPTLAPEAVPQVLEVSPTSDAPLDANVNQPEGA